MSLNIIQKPVSWANFHRGRNGHTPIAIVIHIEDGTEIGTDAWFDDPAAHVSSHYSVKKDGEIHQYVKESDSAAANGIVDRPSWTLYTPGINPNLVTISIEHEGKSGDALTDAQKASSVALIQDIAARNNIPLDTDHVIPHHAIRFMKPCPGPGVDISELITLAQPQVAPTDDQPTAT